MKKLLAFLAIPVALTGCVLPYFYVKAPDGETHGRPLRAEDVVFLKEPGISRTDVIQFLGSPDWFLSNEGIMVYVWEESEVYASWGLKRLNGSNAESGRWETSRREALLIALDERQFVTRYEFQSLDIRRKVEDIAREWGDDAPTPIC